MDEPLEDSQPVEAEPPEAQQKSTPEAQQVPAEQEPPTDVQEPPVGNSVAIANGNSVAVKSRRGGRASLNRGPLTEKQECPDCNKVLSKHSLIYNTHKCAAKKKIVIENIEPLPTETVKSAASKTEKGFPEEENFMKAPPQPRNYIDLDGDIDYDHQHVHNLVTGFFRHNKDKERAQKQERFRGMLAGRL